jgi:hypothetical protein
MDYEGMQSRAQGPKKLYGDRVQMPIRISKGLRNALRRKAGHRNVNRVVTELVKGYVVGKYEVED